MRDSIKRWMGGLLGGAVLGFCASAPAGYTPGSGYTFNLGAEGIDATVGADMQIRLEGYQRTVKDPEMRSTDMGPAYEYLRLRERVWVGVKVQDWMKINARLVNRWQYFWSRPGKNNDGAATWEFPDEVVFDQLNLQLLNIADSNWSLTIGRQDLSLGNGMIFLESSPTDGGRTLYFDGISVNWKPTEHDNLKLFAFYNTYRDRTLVINDQERALRRGDIFTAGADWTHTFNKAFSTELYYVGASVNADTDTDKHNVGDTVLHTVGARVFGAPHEQIDYSVEFAREYGERKGIAGHDADMSGTLIDARLTLKMPKDTTLSPSLLLQYTYFSGDDPSTGDVEGWDPIFASYPIYRDELLPTMTGSNWTNLHQPRIMGKLVFNKQWSAAVAYAYMIADESDLALSGGRGGKGNCFGQQVSAFVDYKPFPWLSFALEVADFFPGDYFDDGDNGIWGRFQTTLTF